jgi:NMD protein affecting ribosome stability and mRNA decay
MTVPVPATIGPYVAAYLCRSCLDAARIHIVAPETLVVRMCEICGTRNTETWPVYYDPSEVDS